MLYSPRYRSVSVAWTRFDILPWRPHSWLIKYFLTESEVFTVKYQTRFDILPEGKYISECRGLIFYPKDRTVEVNK